MKHIPIVLVATLAFATTCRAQMDPCARDHGYKVLVECEQLADDQWENKLSKLATIPLSDSLYERAVLSRCSILIGKERWEESLLSAEEGIRMAGTLEHYFQLDKATALTSMGRYDEGMAWFDRCIARYPGSFLLPYLKALSAIEHKDNVLALALLKELVHDFPLDPRGHATLGSIARKEGRTAQAAMALSMALIVSWGGAADESRLVELDRVLGSVEAEPQGYDLATGEDFEEIDLLLKNRVAMERKYKVEPDLEFPMCRQSHLLFSFLEKSDEGTGFWNSYYAPLFRRIMRENLFEGFVYHCLASSSAEKVNTLAKKNATTVQLFRKRTEELLKEMYQTYPDSSGATPTLHWYNSDGGLDAVGRPDATTGRYTGPFTTYHASGAIAAHGTLDSDTKRSGLWLDHHPNAALSKRAVFLAGMEEGVFQTWSPEGYMQDSAVVTNGKLNGPYHSHTSTGGLRQTRTWVNGTLNGPVIEYFPCGTIENHYDMVADEFEGLGKSFFPDGREQFKGTYAHGKRTGTHTVWHHNGQKANEGEFVEGEAHGPFKEWHPNGQLAAEGTRLKGALSGTYKAYAPDGILKEEGTYDDNGRSIGIYRNYAEDGKPWMEQEFQHGLLVRYRYFDRAGRVVNEGERKKGKFQLTGSSLDGNRIVSGIYLDEGLKDGTWIYYAEDGTPRSEERFDKGEVTGAQRQFDEAGRLKLESDYTLPERTGAYKQFYPDGKPEYIGWAQNGRLNGALRRFLPDGTLWEDRYLVDGEYDGWQRYFDVDGKPFYSERIKDGTVRERVLYDGTGKEYQRYVTGPGAAVLKETWPTGEVMSTTEVVNGVRHGKNMQYYVNGKVSVEGKYVNGERDGVWTSYYPNGKKATENQWEQGVRTGVHRSWYEDGTLHSEEPFENDVAHGLYKVFDRGGQQVLERHRAFGQEHGIARSWASDGSLQFFRYYDHDRLFAYASPKSDGTAGDTVPLPQGVQEMKPVFPNGRTAREMRMRNGEVDGVYREFYPSGTLMEETPYSVGKITGTSVEYYPDGKLRESTEYLMGMRHGAYVRNGPNGKAQEEGTFRYGELHGDRKLYDGTGKHTATYVYRSGDLIAIK